MQNVTRHRPFHRGWTVAALSATVLLGVSACGGSSGSNAGARSHAVVTTTGLPAAEVPSGAAAKSDSGGASPTVTVFARTDAPADQVLAGASKAIQQTPNDVLAVIAEEILVYRTVDGPVRYARVTKSSVFSERMKWFTDEELDGITYLVLVPHRESRGDMSYFLVTARAMTDLRDAHQTNDATPADLSSLGEIKTLTEAELDSVSDWRPFLNRAIKLSSMRSRN